MESEEDPSSITEERFRVTRKSVFSPKSKDMHVRLICYSKLEMVVKSCTLTHFK